MASTLRECRTGSGDDMPSPRPANNQLDLLAEFSSELERLSASQRALMEELRSDGTIDLDAEESTRLRTENAALRARVEELERQAHTAAAGDDAWTECQVEYEKLLDEKSEIIRTLNLKLRELQAAPAPPPETPLEVHDAAVERMKRELEEQRRQLQQDEENLMQQMRDMELALAKDRADLARRRADLQRQQTDFARDVEMASRDPQLRERLAALQRRPHDNRGQAPSEARPEPTPAATPKKESGLLRRIFG